MKALTLFRAINTGGEDMKLGKKILSVFLMCTMIVSQFNFVATTKAASENILTGKTYTNSTYSSSSPAYTVDGNTGSYWDAGYYTNVPWITFDLGGFYLVDSVNVVNFYAYGDGRYYHYDVLVSIDGVNYTTIAEKRGTNVATSSGDTIEFTTPVYAKYIKFVGIHNSANLGFHFNELRAYGSVVENVDENTNSEKSKIEILYF